MKKKGSELAEQFQFSCPYCGKSIRLSEVLSHGMKEGLEQEVAGRVKVRENELAKKAREKAEEEVSLELKDLKEQVAEKERRLEFVERTELALRKDRRHLEEERKRIHLDVVRKLDGERRKFEEEVAKRIGEENRLRDLEKDKKMMDLVRQIQDLKHKAEATSGPASGEVMEVQLETVLRKAFPSDEVVPVPRGIKGADVLQKVLTPSGRCCGTIMWESKQTQHFKDEWLRKMLDDRIRIKAELAALVTSVLPKGICGFGLVEQIWVMEPSLVTGVATALRLGLIQAEREEAAREGKGEKMEALYSYLAGANFRARVTAIVEAFTSLKKGLDDERKTMERVWAKRGKELERVIGNTVGFYGDLEGIVGASLPAIPSLELPALAAGGEAS